MVVRQKVCRRAAESECRLPMICAWCFNRIPLDGLLSDPGYPAHRGTRCSDNRGALMTREPRQVARSQSRKFTGRESEREREREEVVLAERQRQWNQSVPNRSCDVVREAEEPLGSLWSHSLAGAAQLLIRRSY